MKIAYLASPILPSRAAHSVHIMKMCEAFSCLGHEVHLIGAMRSKVENQDVWDFYDVDRSFEIIYLPKPYPDVECFPETYLKGTGNMINSAMAVKEALKIDPDIAYSRNETTAYLACLAGLSTIYESHVPVPFEQFGTIRDKIFRSMLKKDEFKLLVVISESIEEYYKDNYDLERECILLARDAAEVPKSNSSPIMFDNDKELQVGYIGNLYQGRGKDVIASMARECDFAHFHIVGGDEKSVEDWKKAMDGSNVTFHGFIHPSGLDDFRVSFDVCLAPYKRDLKVDGGQNTARWMSPLKIFEYMGAGKPIIASDLPAIREILEDEETALLCDPEKPERWVKALKRLKGKELRKRLAKKAKKRFMENHTWEKRARDIVETVSSRLE